MGTTPDLVIVDSSVTGALDPLLLLAAFREGLAGVGVRGVTDGELIAALGRDSLAALDDIAASRGVMGPAALQAVRLFAARTVRDLAERRHPPVPAAGEALACLRAAHIPCVLVSDLPTPVVDALLLRHGWRGLLHATLSIDQVESERPAPDIIHEVMALVGIRQSSSVANIVGHSHHLQAGRAAGVGWNVAIGWTAASPQRAFVDVMRPDLLSAAQRLLVGMPRAETSTPAVSAAVAGGPLDRQDGPEHRALAQHAVNGQPPALALDGVADQGQSQAGAAERA